MLNRALQNLRKTSYIKFDMSGVTLKASQVSSAYVRLKFISGDTPRTLYARRLVRAWDSKTLTSETTRNPALTTTETGAANISAVGALEGNNWYVMRVNTMVKNILNGSATNYGWRIKDKTTEANNEVSTFCSSDYGYPYRPELVVNYTDSTVYCGNRAYENWTSKNQNCMGYALDVFQYIKPSHLKPTDTAMKDITTLDELVTYINALSTIYMANHSDIGASNFESISSYKSDIKTNRYRAVLRVGYNDINHVSGLQLSCNPSGDYAHDAWDYHWWYQTNTGQWAEKSGEDPSHRISGTNSSTNPGSASNQALWGEFYNSKCKYFAIKPNPNN